MARPVFVGDVQGCARELRALCARVDAELGHRDWELWLVGDLVNRGPASLEVLRFVRERMEADRARTVLGNHELALLRTALGLRELAPGDTFGDVLAADPAEGWIHWLRRRPVALCGQLGASPFAMVHAAVHPAWSLGRLAERAAALETRLREADPAALRELLRPGPHPPGSPGDELGRLLSCRSVAPEGEAWSSQPPGGGRIPWHEAWRAQGHAYGVVYGHWALQGLHVAPGLRGLDTGCVHHGRGRDGFLTAWLPDPQMPDAFAAGDARFLHVRAFARYRSA